MQLPDKVVAMSLSDGDDWMELGLPPDLSGRLLKAILAPLLQHNCRIAYSGSLDHPSTKFTFIESEKIGQDQRRVEESPRRPFVHYLAQRALADTPVRDLVAHLRLFARHGEIGVVGVAGILGTLSCIGPTCERICISRPHCESVAANGAAGLTETSYYQQLIATAVPDAATSLRYLRQRMALLCDARLQVGGRKAEGAGDISGVCEEALLTIESGKPLMLLGGFGGATRDIAAAVGLLDAQDGFAHDPLPDNPDYKEGLELIRRARPRFESIFSAAELEALRMLARTRSVDEAGQLVAQVVLPRVGTR